MDIRDNPELLSHVSLVVVDELQTLGDESRGATIEMLLTLIRMRNPEIQIIGLSAALPNADEIASWLEARVCRTSTRDIPLIEEVWSKPTVHSKQFGTGLDSLQARPNSTATIETLGIVRYLISEKQTPLVVFCMTKPRAEELARAHYETLQRGTSAVRKLFQEVKQLLLFFTEGGPTGRSLMGVIDAGIAFHHSDLSADERRVIEDKIRDGTIEVVYSTTTLGQGVNLPIATVVFDDVYRHWLDKYIDKREYINMAGRAGRRGLSDERGTSILICRSAKDRQKMNEYLSEETERIDSVLGAAPLDAVILNLIASNDASTVTDVQLFLEKSFFGARAAEHNPKLLKARIEATPAIIGQLQKDGFVLRAAEGKYRPAQLGRITSQKGILPATALRILKDLRAIAGAVRNDGKEITRSADELSPALIHLLIDADGNTGPMYRDGTAFAFLDNHRSSVCKLRSFEDSADPYKHLQVAWVLSEWVKGTSYQKLCAPFRKLREGVIRQSAEHCAWMVDSAAALARIPELGFDPRLARFLSVLTKRLVSGVPEEGIALMEVIRNRTSLGVELGGIGRARVVELIGKGFDDLTKIVEAEDNQLVSILRNPEQVQNLKIAIARYLERVSESLLPTHIMRSKKFSREDLIRSVYEKSGTEFEAAMFDLLRSTGLTVEMLDDRKVQGCADLLVATSSGNIQTECKTRAKGLITNAEAFEVLGKTIVGPKPIAYATIGKPGFVDVAIKNSFDNGVTLATHKLLCEAALLVLEGKKTSQQIIDLLMLRRYVDPRDLR